MPNNSFMAIISIKYQKKLSKKNNKKQLKNIK